jgi:hypothetical protein
MALVEVSATRTLASDWPATTPGIITITSMASTIAAHTSTTLKNVTVIKRRLARLIVPRMKGTPARFASTWPTLR